MRPEAANGYWKCTHTLWGQQSFVVTSVIVFPAVCFWCYRSFPWDELWALGVHYFVSLHRKSYLNCEIGEKDPIMSTFVSYDFLKWWQRVITLLSERTGVADYKLIVQAKKKWSQKHCHEAHTQTHTGSCFQAYQDAKFKLSKHENDTCLRLLVSGS